MSVQWREISLVPSGIDQFTDNPHVLVTQLLAADNVRFFNPPKAAKRYGYLRNTLSTTLGSSPITKATRVHALAKQTVLCSDSVLYAQSEKNFKMADRGRLSELLVERAAVHHDQTSDRKDADLAFNQDILVVAWPAGAGEVGAMIINTKTEAVIQTVTWDNVGGNVPSWVRCISLGNYILIFGDFNAGAPGTTIKVLRIDVTSSGEYIAASGPVPTTISTPAAPIPGVLPDVAAISSTEYVVAYFDNASDFKIIRCDVATHTIQATYTASVPQPSCIAIEGVAGENVYSAREDTGQILATVHNASTLGSVAGPTNINSSEPTRIGIVRLSSTQRLYTWEVPFLGSVRGHVNYRTCSSTASFGTLSTLPDLVPSSKPFIRDGKACQWVAYNEPAQPTFYLAELTDNNLNALQNARWVGTAARGIAKQAQTIGYLHAVATKATDVYETAITCNYRVRFASKDDKTVSIARAGVYRLKMDFSSALRHDAAVWGKSLVFAGSRPSIFDGESVGELGFAWYPQRFDVVDGPGPGTDVRKCCLVYEWEDNLGQIHRSVPSRIIDMINPTVSVTLRETLWATHGQFGALWSAATKVRVIPYRTINNGLDFFRDSTRGFDAVYANNFTVGGEFASDAALQVNDMLYISGDILDNAGTPPCSLVATHGDRMWLGGLEEPEWVAFSQPFVEGEAPRFNEALRVLIGKPVRAFASMDGQFICFTDSEIYAVVGSGPPATGGLDVGFQVALVSSETGCTEPRSVVLTSEGLGFMGRKGYCMLDRALQLQWIGIAAKNFFDTFGRVQSANVTPDGRFLYVGATDAGSIFSVIHVYDLVTKQWTLDNMSDDLGNLVDATIAWDASRSAWGYATISSQGGLFWEKPNYYLDGGGVTGDYAWSITTAWVHRASLGAGGPLQGWEFIREAYLLGDFSNCQGLQIQVGYDFDSAYTTTYTFTAAELAALERSQVMIDFEFMTCESFRMRITELFTGGETPPNTAGPNLREITIIAGFQRGGFRIQDAAAK